MQKVSINIRITPEARDALASVATRLFLMHGNTPSIAKLLMLLAREPNLTQAVAARAMEDA